MQYLPREGSVGKDVAYGKCPMQRGLKLMRNATIVALNDILRLAIFRLRTLEILYFCQALTPTHFGQLKTAYELLALISLDFQKKKIPSHKESFISEFEQASQCS